MRWMVRVVAVLGVLVVLRIITSPMFIESAPLDPRCAVVSSQDSEYGSCLMEDGHIDVDCEHPMVKCSGF